MSTPRYPWWGYIKAVIRDYPTLHEQLVDSKTQPITARYSAAPMGGGDGRIIESLALKSLARVEQLQHDAVENAIKATYAKDTAPERLKLIDMLLWSQTHTLHGAAAEIHISYRTARRWHSEFMYLVASGMGVFDFPEPKMAPQSLKSSVK